MVETSQLSIFEALGISGPGIPLMAYHLTLKRARLLSSNEIDRVELGSFDPKEFPKLLEKLALSQQKVERLSLAEFAKSFSQVNTLFPDCKFNVDIVEHSFDTRPRDVIRPIFWPSSYKKAPDIQ